jgi:uncharacterized RDD family membrane protein YckC
VSHDGARAVPTGMRFRPVSVARRLIGFAIDFVVVMAGTSVVASVLDRVRRYGPVADNAVAGAAIAIIGVGMVVAAADPMWWRSYHWPVAVRALAVLGRLLAFAAGQLMWFVLLGVSAGTASRHGSSGFWEIPGGLIIPFIYWVGMEWSPLQTTVGKFALGLMVRGVDQDRISLAQACGRYFGRALHYVPVIGLGLLVSFPFTERAAHDLVTRTVVVPRRRPFVDERPTARGSSSRIRIERAARALIRRVVAFRAALLPAESVGVPIPLVVTIAWLTAVASGLFLIVIGLLASGHVVGIVGIIFMGLAFSLRRGERTAAWILGGFALVSVALSYPHFLPGLVISLALAGLSFCAAFAIRGLAPSLSRPEQWKRLVSEVAFLRCGWFLVLGVRALVHHEGWISWIGHVLGALIEGGLGLAVVRRHAWGLYGLALTGCLGLFSVLDRSAIDIEVAIALVIVYGLGAYYVRPIMRRGKRRRSLASKLSGRGTEN